MKKHFAYILIISFQLSSYSSHACPMNVQDRQVSESTVEIENVVTFGDEASATDQEIHDYKKLTSLVQDNPTYPPTAKRAHHCGDINFFVEVMPDGSTNSVVIQHSNSDKLSLAVEDAAKKWRFHPFKAENGRQSIIGKFIAKFRLTLEDGEKVDCKP